MPIGDKAIKLSIIIPCYNAEPYIRELLDGLNAQIIEEVEVIIVDDGSSELFQTDYSWATVIRKKNGGCSTARNVGLDRAIGEYVSFIDADDMVPISYVNTILQKIKGGYDVIDLSWRSLTTKGAQHDHKLQSDNDYLTNPSVCTRVFKRSFIGDIRFNEKKDSTEDEDFSRKVGYIFRDSGIKHGAISEYLYFYRTEVSNSKIKRFKKGLMKTKRIVYHYPSLKEIDKDCLLDQIKKADETNEVWLLTYDVAALSSEFRKYSQIHVPFAIWGHELRGDPFPGFIKINPPEKTQIVLYCEYANKIGGISTFIYNFCREMRQYYDIIFVYEKMDIMQLSRLIQIVPVRKWSKDISIVCDYLIVNRITDKLKDNIIYKKSIQVLHCCKQLAFDIPTDRDILVNVSKAAKDSWGEASKDGIVINNMLRPEAKDMLFLVSATRVGASDKGDNDKRMLKLARMLIDAHIPYLWLNFSDNQLREAPEGIINMKPTLRIQDYIKKADYLVQLSDEEAYSYSILEALVNNTAVLATPFPSLFEEGFKDGKNGYLIPYDMNFDVEKLLNVPEFCFSYDNQAIIERWREVLGKTKKVNKKLEDCVLIKVIRSYRDIELNEELAKGTELVMRRSRAEHVASLGYIEIVSTV